METFEYKQGIAKHIVRYSDVLIEHQMGSKVIQIKPHEVKGVAINEPFKQIKFFRDIANIFNKLKPDMYAGQHSPDQGNKQSLDTIAPNSVLVFAVNDGMTPDKNKGISIPLNLADPQCRSFTQKVITRFASQYLGALPAIQLMKKLKIRGIKLPATFSWIWIFIFIIAMNILRYAIEHLDF
jgi:hypothetical protein